MSDCSAVFAVTNGYTMRYITGPKSDIIGTDKLKTILAPIEKLAPCKITRGYCRNVPGMRVVLARNVKLVEEISLYCEYTTHADHDVIFTHTDTGIYLGYKTGGDWILRQWDHIVHSFSTATTNTQINSSATGVSLNINTNSLGNFVNGYNTVHLPPRVVPLPYGGVGVVSGSINFGNQSTPSLSYEKTMFGGPPVSIEIAGGKRSIMDYIYGAATYVPGLGMIYKMKTTH